MKDPHPYVRDTTAWTIGRVFEFQHDAGNTDVPELITRETLPQVAQVRPRCVVLCVVLLELSGMPPVVAAGCGLAAQQYLPCPVFQIWCLSLHMWALAAGLSILLTRVMCCQQRY
jgi:hypothetical protein